MDDSIYVYLFLGDNLSKLNGFRCKFLSNHLNSDEFSLTYRYNKDRIVHYMFYRVAGSNIQIIMFCRP